MLSYSYTFIYLSCTVISLSSTFLYYAYILYFHIHILYLYHCFHISYALYNLSYTIICFHILETVGQFGLQYSEQTQGTLGSLVATPSLLSRVIESQWQDVEIVSIRDRVQSGTGDEGRTVHADGSLQYRRRVVVPQLIDLREEILREFHCSRFTVHPGGKKMYQGLRHHYYWSGMKRHVGDFVRRCLTCQQVKAEYQKPAGLLQPLEVAEWKWEHVTMDFVTYFPWTQQRHDAVWVIVDRLTKSAHFFSSADDLLIGEILPVLHSRNSPATWSTSIHSVG